MELAEHTLNVYPDAKPVKQPTRRNSEPRRRAIGEEVNRLLEAGFIREIKQATWVANPVLVPKKNTTKLRMCVDYTSLNKHCPKDHFPLPRINQIIDATSGCDRLSFLDAYSGYNQIGLKVDDEEKTAFITPYGVFCFWPVSTLFSIVVLLGLLVKFLREQWRIFAWCPADMPGIPRELAEHSLNVYPDAKPVKQPTR